MSEEAQDLETVATAVAELEIEGPQAVETPTAEEAVDEDEVTMTVTMADGETTGPIPLRALEDARDQLFDDRGFIDGITMDGHAADELRFAFGGTIAFPADDPKGQELFEALTLGKAVELRVAGRVVKKLGTWKEKANDEESVAGQVGIKVDTVYLLAPEAL